MDHTNSIATPSPEKQPKVRIGLTYGVGAYTVRPAIHNMTTQRSYLLFQKGLVQA